MEWLHKQIKNESNNNGQFLTARDSLMRNISVKIGQALPQHGSCVDGNDTSKYLPAFLQRCACIAAFGFVSSVYCLFRLVLWWINVTVELPSGLSNVETVSNPPCAKSDGCYDRNSIFCIFSSSE